MFGIGKPEWAFILLIGVIVFISGLLKFVLKIVRNKSLSSDLLREKRKFVILIICIFSAAATPPDLVTLLIVALPLWLLYELGILWVKNRELRAFQ